MLKMLAPALALTLAAFVAPAHADDRPLTDQERTQLIAAMQAEGCSGGEMEFDDGKFEVDDARCSDGKEYGLHYDTSFKLIRKRED